MKRFSRFSRVAPLSLGLAAGILTACNASSPVAVETPESISALAPIPALTPPAPCQPPTPLGTPLPDPGGNSDPTPLGTPLPLPSPPPDPCSTPSPTGSPLPTPTANPSPGPDPFPSPFPSPDPFPSPPSTFDLVGPIEKLPRGYPLGRDRGFWLVDDVWVRVNAATLLPAERFDIGDIVAVQGRRITPRYIIASRIRSFDVPPVCPVPSPFPASISVPSTITLNQPLTPILNLSPTLTNLTDPPGTTYDWSVTPSDDVNPATTPVAVPHFNFTQTGQFTISVSGSYVVEAIDPHCPASTVFYSATASVRVINP